MCPCFIFSCILTLTRFNENYSWFDPMFYWISCLKFTILQQHIIHMHSYLFVFPHWLHCSLHFFFEICPGSCFVLVMLFAFLFASCFLLFYILFRSCLCLCFFLFWFLSRFCSCSCFLFLSDFVSKKICLNSVSSFKKKVAEILEKKEKKKESWCLIFEHEIKTVRGFF